MRAIRSKLPELCGYALTILALLLMGYTAACAPQPQEQWNSYYYGTVPQIEQGIMYYDTADADDNYSLPGGVNVADDQRNLLMDGILHGERR